MKTQIIALMVGTSLLAGCGIHAPLDGTPTSGSAMQAASRSSTNSRLVALIQLIDALDLSEENGFIFWDKTEAVYSRVSSELGSLIEVTKPDAKTAQNIRTVIKNMDDVMSQEDLAQYRVAIKRARAMYTNGKDPAADRMANLIAGNTALQVSLSLEYAQAGMNAIVAGLPVPKPPTFHTQN